MLYNSDLTKNIEKNDVAFLPAGIHDDVKYDGTRYEKTQFNEFIEFKFSKNGRSVTHTEWAPKRGDNETDAAYIDKCKNQLIRFQHIVGAAYSPTVYPHLYDVDDKGQYILKFQGATFKDLCDWATSMLDQADKNIRFRIKVVYNDRGYTSLPRYTKYTFIEPMSVVIAGESKISTLSIDIMEKPVVADKETTVKNELAAESSVNIDDLPF